MRKLLVDTAPLVAILAKRDKHHKRCLEFFAAFKGALFTTEAVVTESLYFLSKSIEAQMAFLELLERYPIEVVLQVDRLKIRQLMLKYKDIPMDYADATLVSLAQSIDVPDIFTLDRRGFESYRFGRNQRFNICPE